MVTITLTGELEGTRKAPLEFRIPARSVLLAGSRNGFVDPEEAQRITAALAAAGFSFLVGGATVFGLRRGPAFALITTGRVRALGSLHDVLYDDLKP